MEKLEKLFLAMIDYEKEVPSRIQHLTKVHSFARLIGLAEGIDEETQYILEATAYAHDIGIKPSYEKYGHCKGPFQEKEGVEPAKKMLAELGFEEKVIDRVCWLIAHHHTYTDVEGMDYQILLEADFLVNLFEDNEDKDAIRAAYDKIFRTETGKHICKTMFGI